MARVNTGASSLLTERTHEGAPAYNLSAEQELRRAVLTCMLWENNFYESGKSITDRIADLVPKVQPEKVAALAIEARSQMQLRHAPLFLVREMARHAAHRKYVRATLNTVIQRADEMAEFLAIYWKDKKQPLAKSVQRGLADAFTKFSPYQLAKYNRDNAVKLRDVLFLSHAKPKNAEQASTFAHLVSGTLPTPDTWEVAITACGKDAAKKKAEWTRLLDEKKLGAFALIRNLRNMTQCDVSDRSIRAALREMQAEKLLPFRFIAAARIMPSFVTELEAAMLANLDGQATIPGRTVVLVDVSASMTATISTKSDMTRMDAATGLAVLAREVCESVRVFSFSYDCVEVPAYRGLALVNAIKDSQPNGGTYLGKAVSTLNKLDYDRLIVITDEQSADHVPGPKGKGYVVNVASHKAGVGYGPWTHIDGWSDRALDYIRVIEAETE